MADSPGALVADIRRQLRAHADPRRAPGQQAYMKSTLPFLGVRVPEVRRLTRAAAQAWKDPAALRAAARSLWDTATHREERYAAMMLLAVPPVRGDLESIPLIEHMIRTGAWWDITDELASRIGEMLDADHEHTSALVRRWAADDDLWLRRVAIIAQLGRRDRTDTALLAEVIAHNADDPEFFIRKAIGWALREYARTRPEWVHRFAATQPMSALSLREALKHAQKGPERSGRGWTQTEHLAEVRAAEFCVESGETPHR